MEIRYILLSCVRHSVTLTDPDLYLEQVVKNAMYKNDHM